MKTCEEHCARTLKRYGVSGKDIHEWMDAPVLIAGPGHRRFRHDIKKDLPNAHLVFDSKYGRSMVENIFLDHLIADAPRKRLKEEHASETEPIIPFPGEKYIKLRCGWVRNDSNNFVATPRSFTEGKNHHDKNLETNVMKDIERPKLPHKPLSAKEKS